MHIAPSLINDYVAGRLDPVTILAVEAAARSDGRIARAIGEARVVHGRVQRRFFQRAA
ncbi:MAG: hypothetical protein ACT4N2_01435 [Hyphomicrobium sp.]